MDIFQFLKDHSIEYQRVDHPPVFTCEEAARLVPKLDGTDTKNLFLRDKKGKRHFLVTVRADKSVDLRGLGEKLGVGNLSFASPERLKTFLGIEPGSVSLLAVINDAQHVVEVVVDQDVWQGAAVLCHPLINTSTLLIQRSGMEAFLKRTGHIPRVVEL